MTECDIQAELGCHYGVDKGQIVVPSVLLGPYEADFITITKSDYLIEVEIKISISDFRADFKKKHYHDCPEVNALYYALPKELYDYCIARVGRYGNDACKMCPLYRLCG